MGSPRKSALRPLEPLEARDVPATGPLADLNTTGAPAFPPLGALEPSGAAVGPAVYFTATDAAGVNGLWRSDGTAGGTTRVADVTPQVTSVGLPDPHGLLEGSGSQVRGVRLQPISRLEAPEVGALIDAAVAAASPLPASGEQRLIIKSISAKQRPRRPKS